MFHWLHHLINPHCELCIEERACNACDVRQRQIEYLQLENKKLLDRLINPISEVEKAGNFVQPEPIFPTKKPWGVVQRQLEREDREEAARLRKKKEEELKKVDTARISELEKELDIPVVKEN